MGTRIGIHVSIRDRIDLAADRAKELHCEAIQIFSCNPRSWSTKPLDAEAAGLFRQKLQQFDIHPLVVHVTYLPNLASPERAQHRKSVRRVTSEVKRADRLGAGFFVTHLGHHMGAGVDAGLANIVRALDEIISKAGPEVMILLENTADGRGSVGGRFEHLAQIIEETADPDRIGICFDTAHAFAAGYDLRTPEAVDRTLKELDKVVGLHRLRVVHANDAMLEFGSHRDRHQQIGKGNIGRDGLRALLNHPKLSDLPFILETPIDVEGDDARNIRRLKRLRNPETTTKRTKRKT